MIARESLEPLVGRMVRLTRRDIPGYWIGLLEGLWRDGVICLLIKEGVKEYMAINQIETIELEGKNNEHTL